MLINFSLTNFKSFKSSQFFSMQAAKHTRLEDHLISLENERFLKCGVLFGANAAGKSNFICAIEFAKNIVIDGIIPGEMINKYFRIDDNFFDIPGSFEFTIESNGHKYNYGFSILYNDNKIVSEWLNILDKNRNRCIFHRDCNNSIVSDYSFSDKSSRQRFKIYSEDVTDQKTLLSEIASHKLNDVDDFKAFFDVYSWFEELIIIFPESIYNGYTQFIANDSKRNSLIRELSYFDTGIIDIIGDENSVDKVFEFLPEKIRNRLVLELQTELSGEGDARDNTADISINNKRISISRKTDGTLIARQLMMSHGNPTSLFDLGDESDGTRRLFDIVPILGKALEERVILVDELDRSFHTKLTQEFLKKYFNNTRNKHSQLIFSTHDVNILSLDKFRQDEIWFVERQSDNSSKLYSLKSFKERFDKDISKEYLLGKYGALPEFLTSEATLE